MKCSECGGRVLDIRFGVYYRDGSVSGNYKCLGCKKRKPYFHKGPGETVIDMRTNEEARK